MNENAEVRLAAVQAAYERDGYYGDPYPESDTRARDGLEPPKNWGVAVCLRLTYGADILRNVTEIHYGYKSALTTSTSGRQIAFESDLHHSGTTHWMHEVVEFETCPEYRMGDHMAEPYPFDWKTFKQTEKEAAENAD